MKLVEQKHDLGECIINFFTLYYREQLVEYEENVSKELLSAYHELLNCIDHIAYLSTMDGATILYDDLSLAGVRGIVKRENLDNLEQDNLNIEYLDIKKDPFFGEPRLLEEVNKINDLWEQEDKIIIELLEKVLKNNKENKWNPDNFGTRHGSAASLCTDYELDPFVFVVSQSGDIRQFFNLKDKEKKYIGVFGPLRPL